MFAPTNQQLRTNEHQSKVAQPVHIFYYLLYTLGPEQVSSAGQHRVVQPGSPTRENGSLRRPVSYNVNMQTQLSSDGREPERCSVEPFDIFLYAEEAPIHAEGRRPAHPGPHATIEDRVPWLRVAAHELLHEQNWLHRVAGLPLLGVLEVCA